jgi:hypothetical protein
VHKALTAPQRHARKRNRNYGPTVLSQKEAEKMGYNQILWLYGPDHQVTEVGTMNMFVAFQHKNGIHPPHLPPSYILIFIYFDIIVLLKIMFIFLLIWVQVRRSW